MTYLRVIADSYDFCTKGKRIDMVLIEQRVHTNIEIMHDRTVPIQKGSNKAKLNWAASQPYLIGLLMKLEISEPLQL